MTHSFHKAHPLQNDRHSGMKRGGGWTAAASCTWRALSGNHVCGLRLSSVAEGTHELCRHSQLVVNCKSGPVIFAGDDYMVFTRSIVI